MNKIRANNYAITHIKLIRTRTTKAQDMLDIILHYGEHNERQRLIKNQSMRLNV